MISFLSRGIYRRLRSGTGACVIEEVLSQARSPSLILPSKGLQRNAWQSVADSDRPGPSFGGLAMTIFRGYQTHGTKKAPKQSASAAELGLYWVSAQSDIEYDEAAKSSAHCSLMRHSPRYTVRTTSIMTPIWLSILMR